MMRQLKSLITFAESYSSHQPIVPEIGTGWGGFAIHAAENYGCRVTTTTISEEQYDHAVQLIRDRGLSDQITVLKRTIGI